MLLILCTVGIAALVEVYTLVIPKKYEAKATLLLTDTDKGGGLGAALAGIGGGLGGGNQADPLEILFGELQSHSALSLISAETGFTEHDLSMPALLDVKPQGMINQLEITANTGNPEKSKGIVASAIKALAKVDSEVAVTSSQREAKYAKEAWLKKMDELQNAQLRLRQFEEASKTAPDPTSPFGSQQMLLESRKLDAQLEVTTKQLDAIRSKAVETTQGALDLPTGMPGLQTFHDQILQLETNLKLSRIQLGDRSPAVLALEQQLAVTKRQLNQEVTKYLSTIHSSLRPDLADLEVQKLVLTWQKQVAGRFAKVAPKEAEQAANLWREVDTLNLVVSQLRAQYESAVVKAEVDKVKWTVLDKPYVRGVSNKNFVLNGLIGLFAGLLVGVMLVTFQVTSKATKALAV